MRLRTLSTLVLICAGILWPIVSDAAGFELKPYGFVKGDFTYASSGVLSNGKQGLAAPNMADTTDAHSFGLSYQTTRFGVRGWATNENHLEVGGKLELDLSTSTGNDANAKPRIRLAYAWVANQLFELRVGQQADLFSAVSPTMSTGASLMFFAGNLDTRRNQFQFSAFIPENTTAPIVSVAICEAAREVDGLGADNFAGFPMVQARGSIELQKKYQFGVAVVHAEFDPDPETEDDTYSTLGYSFDYNLRFHSLFSLRGEVNTGRNLANANFATIAGAGRSTDTRHNFGYFANAVSKLHKHFSFSAGAGMDNNTSDKIAAGAFEKNAIVYGECIFPVVNGFSVETEVGQIQTWYKDSETRSAIFSNLCCKLDF